MCSVVGYVGAGKSASFILEGLSRSEYRGYDSAGFACLLNDSSIACSKTVHGLTDLARKLADLTIDGSVGIGHSRWATHGKPSENNAHPHLDCHTRVAVVHNGIIENYASIRKELERTGHLFRSDTDTEVIAHFFESLLYCNNTEDVHGSSLSPEPWSSLCPELCLDTLKRILVTLVSVLHGSYAILILLKQLPDMVIVLRKHSPVCIGIGDGEMFIASDTSAFAGKTNRALFIPDQSFAFVTKDQVALYDFSGKQLTCQEQVIETGWHEVSKGTYEHFMLKEIYEQRESINKTIDFLRSIEGSVEHYVGLSRKELIDLETIHLIGCGTSWHAARIAQFFFEHVLNAPVSVSLASEFRYMPFFPRAHTLHIAISQSGETADTLEALRIINTHTMQTLALTNSASSTMVREARGFLLTQAGREIAVASTKAFSTQLVALYWLAHRIALEKNMITAQHMDRVYDDISYAATILENTIEKYKQIISERYAKQYACYTQAIFLGRHSSYPFAMEAALKLKEIAYIFAQCYPAGELKHGPLALIDEHTPVFVFSHQDTLIYQKLVSNVQEVKARDGHIIAFTFEGQYELQNLADVYFEIPRVAPLLGPLAMTGLMQFFVYAIAREKKLPIDKPRNLAKSVTVE